MLCLVNLDALAEGILDRKTYLHDRYDLRTGGQLRQPRVASSSGGCGRERAIFGLARALLAALYLGKFPVSRNAIPPTRKRLPSFVGWSLVLGLRAGVDNSTHVWSQAALSKLTRTGDLRQTEGGRAESGAAPSKNH